ncbi:helix-turn-helix domain-containing protein [Streptomyces sp. NPDC054787]
MGEIEDAIERAERGGFTQQPPTTLKGRINFLVKKLKTTQRVAEELGISQRSVERYRKGDRKTPPKEIADRIDDAVRAPGSPWSAAAAASTLPHQPRGRLLRRPPGRGEGIALLGRRKSLLRPAQFAAQVGHQRPQPRQIGLQDRHGAAQYCARRAAYTPRTRDWGPRTAHRANRTAHGPVCEGDQVAT